MTLPQISLGAVNIEAADPSVLATFWAAVTGGTPEPGGDSFFLPATGPGSFAMFFQPLTGPRPDRLTIHLDLTVPWGCAGPRSTGSRHSARRGAGTSWTSTPTCSGPPWPTREGNLFCVAEHPPSAT